jgi:hypothetical protein
MAGWVLPAFFFLLFWLTSLLTVPDSARTAFASLSQTRSVLRIFIFIFIRNGGGRLKKKKKKMVMMRCHSILLRKGTFPTANTARHSSLIIFTHKIWNAHIYRESDSRKLFIWFGQQFIALCQDVVVPISRVCLFPSFCNFYFFDDHRMVTFSLSH